MGNFDNLTLFVSGRVIMLRWFLILLTIFSVGFFSGSTLINFTNPDYLFSTQAFFVVFLILVAFLNLIIFSIYYVVYNKQSNGLLNFLNILQIALDLLIASIIVLLFADLSVFVMLVFFYPIIESIVLFTPLAGFLVSLLSGSVVYLLESLSGQAIYIVGEKISVKNVDLVLLNYTNNDLVPPSILFGAILVLFGFIFSYLHSLIVPKENNRFNESKRRSVAKSENMTSERDLWMRKFSAKIDENNRLLRSKDIELSLAEQKLSTLEHAKSEFISVTTHQLRTPLSAIKWTFNMMLSEQLGAINKEQREFLDKGYQSTLKIMNIVNNLVHIDHDEAKKDDYNFIATDLVEFLKEISLEFSNQAESQNIKLEIQPGALNLPQIDLDKNKMRMVFENLLDNALKYTQRDGQVNVIIKDDRLNTADRKIEILVSDNGVGIPKAEQDKIFHKFFRASNARLQEPDGSGIGLFIAKDVVENHGGTLWFESEENKGTTFHVVLPASHKPEVTQEKE